MTSKNLLLALALGLGLTTAVLSSLICLAPPVYANPGTYYVREGGTSTTCTTPSDPCGSIQQGIDLATAPGDEVWVATGTYVENVSIIHSVRLRGGWDASFATQAPDTYPTTVDGNGDHVISATVKTGTTLIEGLLIEDGRDGIHLQAGTFTVTGNIVRDVTRQGIEIEDGQILLENNIITEIEREGIEIDGGRVIVRANGVYTTGRHGILVEGGTTVIEDNDVRAVEQHSDDDYHGIEVTGNHVVSGNTVTEVDDRGIYARGNVTIVNNTVRDTGGDGIRTSASSTRVEIRGNTVQHSGNDGIDARRAIVLITGNDVQDVDDRGINAEDGALTITDNTIRNTVGDGVRTAGSGTQVDVRGNTVQHTGNDGIDARGNVIAVTNNTVSDCADNAIRAEGNDNAYVESNLMLSSGVGLAIRGAPLFTLTNNMVGEHITGSVELTGTGTGFLYHNTLVGRGPGIPGNGVSIFAPLTVTLVNNIVVSHGVGISATEGATAVVSHTLLWGNGTDPIKGATVIEAPPEFVTPVQHNYHLQPNSPAVDAGIDVGVIGDADGDPRPIGPRPDAGADETGVIVTKQTSPIPVQPGALLTYTIRVANATCVTLTATVTDVLPDHVAPSGTLTWVPEHSLTPSVVWTKTVVVTVETGYFGPLTNVVQVTTGEGVTGVYTETSAFAATDVLHLPMVLRNCPMEDLAQQNP